MRITFLDLRRNPGKILEAIARNEKVTLSKRGHDIAVIIPVRATEEPLSIKASPAFGLWKDRPEMEDPAEYVRRIRKSRFGAL